LLTIQATPYQHPKFSAVMIAFFGVDDAQSLRWQAESQLTVLLPASPVPL
jgi:hypothetical protein